MLGQLESNSKVEWRDCVFESEKKFVDLKKKCFDFGFQINQNLSEFIIWQKFESLGNATGHVNKMQETWK